MYLTKALRIMKITAIILLSACLTASAKGFSQRITLKLKDVPLKLVFIELNKQTGYNFLYSDEMLAGAKKVSLEVRDATLDEVLGLCFKDQPLSFKIINQTIVVKPIPTSVLQSGDNLSTIPPPPITIHGRVVNENGEPVAGATITVKGTKNATASDEDGYFILKDVDENATLVISAVNIDAREIKVGGKTDLATISVKIKVTEGQAVVVEGNTGYQKVKSNEVTGSLVVIDNKTLNQQTGTNILQRLNNVTSGMYFNIGKVNQNPSNKTNISIRGLSTISGPLDPLIVLDNFIYEGDINNINPNDVENITILKDAAAASIWGARAGNGVIVITTKKGRFNQKLKIDFNSDIIITQKPDLFYVSQISPSDEINVEQFIFNKGYFNNQIGNTSQRPALTPAVEIFLKRRNGLITASDSASQINTLKAIDSRDQYEKYFYQKATTQQYSLNLHGGSNNIAWLISGDYDKSIFALKNTFGKANLRFINTYRPLKNLQIEVGANYTSSKAVSGLSTGLTINGRQVPYLQFADNNGNALAVSKYRNGYIDTVGAGNLLDWKYYPLDDYKHDVFTTRQQEIIANVGINYQLFSWLRFNANYQYQKQTANSERNSDLQSYFTRDLINNYAQISSGIVKYIVPLGAVLNESNSNLSSQNFRGQLNFNKSWKNQIISAIAGTELREAISSQSSYRYYGYNSDPLAYASVDFRNTYKTRVPNTFQNIPGSPNLTGTVTTRFVSFYSNASFTYKQKYSIYESVRRDAANVFGTKANDKWNPLWSSGLGWEISKENFYKISWLPYLKLRTSFGISGNVDPSRTPLPVSSSGLLSPYTNLPSQLISVPNNPLLVWEKSKQLNIGFEFSSVNQVLSGSIDYYDKKGSDLYGQTTYDYTSYGRTNFVTKNVANMSGNGVDVLLKSNNINQTFKWTTTLLYNHNTSKTTAYFTTGSQILSTFLGRDAVITPIVNYPLYAIAAYTWGGLNSSGDPQGFLNGVKSTNYNNISKLAKDSGLNSGSIKYMGPSNPTNFGSLINEFSWRGFSASINISYRFGYYFRKPAFSSDALINGGITTADYSKRWQKPGDELSTNVPALVYTNYPQFSSRDVFYRYSEVNVLKADNIRVQYINLAYSLYNKIGKLTFDQIQLYVSVSNLGIIWRANKENLDPDYPSSIPIPKSYTIGIRITL